MEENISELLTSPDYEKVRKIIDSTKSNVESFNKIAQEIVKSYTGSLDNLMSDLYKECVLDENSATSTIERYYLELSNMVYFMVDKLEQAGVYQSISKTAAKEVFSKAYLKNQVKEKATGKNKTTIAELNSMAALESQYEEVVSNIYDSVYQILKGKLAAAQDMMNCLRRILSTRASEAQLSNTHNFNMGMPADMEEAPWK